MCTCGQVPSTASFDSSFYAHAFEVQLEGDDATLSILGIRPEPDRYVVSELVSMAARRCSRWECVALEAAVDQKHPLVVEGVAELGSTDKLRLDGCTLPCGDLGVFQARELDLISRPTLMYMDFADATDLPDLRMLRMRGVWSDYEADGVCRILSHLPDTVKGLQIQCDGALPSDWGQNICEAVGALRGLMHIDIRMDDVRLEEQPEWRASVGSAAEYTVVNFD